MHERRRFLIALSGIGICLLIAAGILFTTPAVLVLDAPSPRAAVVTLPSPLPRLAVPVVAQESVAPAAPRRSGSLTSRVVTPRLRVAEPSLASGNVVPDLTLPAVQMPQAPDTLFASTYAIPVAGVPETSRRSVPHVENEPADHGAVTTAFVTAGTHVGQGFRTVGRTLKNLF
jgi:hypothetical protein